MTCQTALEWEAAISVPCRYFTYKSIKETTQEIMGNTDKNVSIGAAILWFFGVSRDVQ